MEFGALRDGFQGLGDDGGDIIADISQAIHCADEDSAVPAVAIVHDMADAVAQLRRAVHAAGAEHADEVGLDLEVDVVGVGVEFPVSAFRSATSVEDVVAGRLICVPQLVIGISECLGIFLHGGVQTVFKHGFHEGEVHVDVVVQAGILDVGVVDIVVVPGNGDILVDDAALVLELRGASVGAADGLAVPAAADLVHERGIVHFDCLAIGDPGGLGAGCKEYDNRKYYE